MKLRAAIWALAAAGLHFGLAAGAAPAQDAPRIPCASADKACLNRLAKAHPARTAAFWKATLARPIEERIGPAPTGLVEYLQHRQPHPGLRREAPAEQARGGLPVRRARCHRRPAPGRAPRVRRHVCGRLVRGRSRGHRLHGHVPRRRRQAGRRIHRARCRRAGQVHRERVGDMEGEHAVQAGRWLDAAGEDRGRRRTTTVAAPSATSCCTSWGTCSRSSATCIRAGTACRGTCRRARAFRSTTFRGRSIARRTASSRYSTATFPSAARSSITGSRSSAPRTWSRPTTASRETNFPTLYAATNPSDDFAESFVSYVHTVLMKRPWEIAIRHDGKVVKTYRTCWEETRCAAKRRILEDLLR